MDDLREFIKRTEELGECKVLENAEKLNRKGA